MVGLGVLGLLAVGAWWLGSRLSSDAIGILLGFWLALLFGLLPAAALTFMAGRRDAHLQRLEEDRHVYAPPPTVIVLQLPDGSHVLASRATIAGKVLDLEPEPRALAVDVPRVVAAAGDD
jgi:hypothetical protein